MVVGRIVLAIFVGIFSSSVIYAQVELASTCKLNHCLWSARGGAIISLSIHRKSQQHISRHDGNAGIPGIPVDHAPGYGCPGAVN